MTNTLFQISALGRARQVAKLMPTPANGFSVFAKTLGSLGQEVIGGVPRALGGDFEQLLKLQMETQVKMQSISMASNIEKSKHESKMAAIRNVRVA